MLAACGIRERFTAVRPCAGGITNANYAVTLEGGSRVLLRSYRWPHSEPDLERGRKEAFLHDLLLRSGVRVPRVHGVSNEGDCIVMEWIEGHRLRDVAGTQDGPLSVAWEDAGAALRRAHELRPFDYQAGVIVGTHLEPFSEVWGEHHASLIRGHARTLRRLGRITEGQLGRIDATAAVASRVLEMDDHAHLLHNDPHGGNVLVRKDGSRWRLAAWLDWEYAWMGDPEWDLARFEIFTRAQVGAVNEAFWAGYGRRPDPRKLPFYELHAMVWFGSLQKRRPTVLVEAARDYLRDLDRHLDQLGS
ncbi:MAG: phosphotransferase family protein [Candidatus Limnocylindria bacterium]